MRCINNSLVYKNYYASIEFDATDRLLVGHVIGVKAAGGFHGKNTDEIEASFHEAVNHYLEVMERLGKQPVLPSLDEMAA